MTNLTLHGFGVYSAMVWLGCGASLTTLGQDNRFIKYQNNLDESVEIWFRPESASTYLRPPLVLRPRTELQAQLSSAYRGKRYIVLRDEARRDTHIGWIDLEETAKSAKPVILIDGIVVTEMRTRQVAVSVPVMKEVTGQDGRRHTVVVYQQEMRSEEYPVRLLVYNVKVYDREGNEVAYSVRRGSGLSVTTGAAATVPP